MWIRGLLTGRRAELGVSEGMMLPLHAITVLARDSLQFSLFLFDLAA